MAHERNVLVGKQRGNAVWLPVPSLSFTPVEVPVHDVSAPAQTVGGPFHPVLGFGGGLALRVPGQSTSEVVGEVRRLMCQWTNHCLSAGIRARWPLLWPVG